MKEFTPKLIGQNLVPYFSIKQHLELYMSSTESSSLIIADNFNGIEFGNPTTGKWFHKFYSHLEEDEIPLLLELHFDPFQFYRRSSVSPLYCGLSNAENKSLSSMKWLVSLWYSKDDLQTILKEVKDEICSFYDKGTFKKLCRCTQIDIVLQLLIYNFVSRANYVLETFQQDCQS